MGRRKWDRKRKQYEWQTPHWGRCETFPEKGGFILIVIEEDVVNLSDLTETPEMIDSGIETHNISKISWMPW